MLTIFLYNIIYISNLKANLNSLRALHREEVSIYNIEMSLITEADSKKLFYTLDQKWHNHKVFVVTDDIMHL